MRARSAAHIVTWACLALSIAGFLAFGWSVYGARDHGFTLAYGWRIAGGQVPYVDFVYRRPPATLYLHAVWLALPDGFALLASRAAFYLQMGLAAALPTAAAIRSGVVAPTPRLVLLTVAFTALAIHSFPAMAWSTVDGVFFASIGLALLIGSLPEPGSRARLGRRAVASLAFAIAALCKQPFLFVALGFGAFAVGEALARPRGERRALLVASALPALALAAVTTGGLGAVGALPAFFEQIVPATSGGDVLEAGLGVYLGAPAALGLLGSLAWSFMLERALAASSRAALAAVLEALLLAGIVLASPDHLVLGRALFGVALGLTLARLRTWRRAEAGASRRRAGARLLVAAAVLAIGWSASISWGYLTPLLGLGAMALLLPEPSVAGGVRSRWAELAPPAALALTCVVAMGWASWSGSGAAHRSRSALDAPLHEIFPRFGLLYANRGVAEQLRELRGHVDEHALATGRAFTVLNDFPLIHYLVDRQSPVHLDWYYWHEVRGMVDELARDVIDAEPIVVLLKKRSVSPIGWTGGFDVPCEPATFDFWPRFSRRIFESGRLVDSGRFFCVVDLAIPPGRAGGPAVD